MVTLQVLPCRNASRFSNVVYFRSSLFRKGFKMAQQPPPSLPDEKDVSQANLSMSTRTQYKPHMSRLGFKALSVAIIFIIVIFIFAVYNTSPLVNLFHRSPHDQIIGTWVFDECQVPEQCTMSFFKDGTAKVTGTTDATYTWQDDTHMTLDEKGLAAHQEKVFIEFVNDNVLHFSPREGYGYLLAHRQ